MLAREEENKALLLEQYRSAYSHQIFVDFSLHRMTCTAINCFRCPAKRRNSMRNALPFVWRNLKLENNRRRRCDEHSCCTWHESTSNISTHVRGQEQAQQTEAERAREYALEALAASVAPHVDRDPQRVLKDTAASAPLSRCAADISTIEFEETIAVGCCVAERIATFSVCKIGRVRILCWIERNSV
eukprot:SAG31_NODE_25_length_33055_cov_11.407919_10_plen_187_part_00